LGLYNTYSNKVQLNSTTTKVFDFGSSTISGSNTSSVDAAKVLETTIEYEYDQYVGLPTKVTTFSSDTDIATETRYTYPSISNDVVSHISKPLFIRSYITNNFGTSSELLSTVQNTYNNNFNHYGQDLKLPSKVKVLKGELTDESFLEDRILYHDYDAYGNPLEVSKADGTHIVYIWGYNQTQPIAKIENATYAQVSSRVANLQTLSNSDDDRTIDILNSNGTITKVGKEGDLREALRNLRINFKNSLVTTYTYDPLIGVTSVTDPRGDTVYYDYDPFNRLKHVKDKDGNILSQNQYNYKN
jgi:YD repeat-containing protein